MNRRSILQVLSGSVAIAAFAPMMAHAASPEISLGDEGGPALGGYDAVSYFDAGGPQKGKESNATDWKGAKWYFATAENLAAFKAAPEKYAPQYGGYCAFADRKSVV